MTRFKATDRSKVVRIPQRGIYDKEAVYGILDSSFICHIAYLYKGTPVVIPTAYARQENAVWVHGAINNRMLNGILVQNNISLAVTHMDGLVLARSAFHHSMNYRSVVVFGTASKITSDDDKMEALRRISENILPGRWEEVRKPNQQELKATLVVRIQIEEASLKQRSGPPVDNDEDYDLPIWAGVLPTTMKYEGPVADEKMKIDLNLPGSVRQALKVR